MPVYAIINLNTFVKITQCMSEYVYKQYSVDQYDKSQGSNFNRILILPAGVE